MSAIHSHSVWHGPGAQSGFEQDAQPKVSLLTFLNVIYWIYKVVWDIHVCQC